MKKIENIGDYATDPRYATSRLWDKRGIKMANIATLNQIIETVSMYNGTGGFAPNAVEMMLDDAIKTMYVEATEFLRICKQIKEATG